ncbi:hypothetical protein C8R45DRAFT_403325 [Mycena sanguinolenta]|nr:hypothetical protein C8R45DRAFT_403325 [Mycena sanguinolenta]
MDSNCWSSKSQLYDQCLAGIVVDSLNSSVAQRQVAQIQTHSTSSHRPCSQSGRVVLREGSYVVLAVNVPFISLLHRLVIRTTAWANSVLYRSDSLARTAMEPALRGEMQAVNVVRALAFSGFRTPFLIPSLLPPGLRCSCDPPAGRPVHRSIAFPIDGFSPSASTCRVAPPSTSTFAVHVHIQDRLHIHPRLLFRLLEIRHRHSPSPSLHRPTASRFPAAVVHPTRRCA